MKQETKIIILSLAFIFLIIIILFAGLVYSIMYPQQTEAFLNQYGWIIVTILVASIVGLLAYFQGWIKAIRIISLDQIHGGGFFAGITTEEPYEASIKELLFEPGANVPDVMVTVVPTGRLLSAGTVLMPISRSKASDWGSFINRLRLPIKVYNFYGQVITLDEFLASAYGLHINPDNPAQSNPNDLQTLRRLLSKVDKEKARRFIFFEPYERPELIVEAMKGSHHPSEAITTLNALRKQRRFYGVLVEQLQNTLQEIVREYRETVEIMTEYISSQGRASMQRLAIPIKLEAEASGIPAHKTYMSRVAQMMDNPVTQRDIAQKLRQDIQGTAQAMGYHIVPSETLEELEELRKFRNTVLSQVKVEGEGEKKEGTVEKIVKKAEGK